MLLLKPHIPKKVMTLMKFVSLALLMVVSQQTMAQNLSIANFRLASEDLTAQSRKTEVHDQNGERCALIRVQTTQKGFHFDVGTLGVTKVDENHVGEIWVYVPKGVRHLDIHHALLGSLTGWDFPINIQSGRTYFLDLTSDKVFVNNYDDSRKQKLMIIVTPAHSEFSLNGMRIELDRNGRAEQELSFGTYTYRVTCEGYHPKEGQVTIDNEQSAQRLEINDLLPLTGHLHIALSPDYATVYIDSKRVSVRTTEPIELTVGTHEVEVACNGYKAEKRSIRIESDKTTELSVALSQQADFSFNSEPQGATIYVGKEKLGETPVHKVFTTGTYQVRATKNGYREFSQNLQFDSANPTILLRLDKIYNDPNEFYAEANTRLGTYTTFGITIGGYVHNFNAELAVMAASGKSEDIYWNRKDERPLKTNYSPTLLVEGKLGYGIPLGRRFRITPQVGFCSVSLKESGDISTNKAYVASGVIAVRCSAAVSNHFFVSLSPELLFAMSKSSGYEKLSEVSSKIKGWGDGFHIKLGLGAFF